MSVFGSCFLFLRDPHGGVEDLAAMQHAGFTAVFCNIGDHTPSEWEAVVRPRAQQLGMACGPWARTQGPDGQFSEVILAAIVDCAERWHSPLIVNSESELKGTGKTATQAIVDACHGYDAALSVEPWPFDDVEWWPLADKLPVLPQVFGALNWYDPIPVRDQWHAYGVNCCYPTYGTYGGSQPGHYPLQAPYSLYTADDCGGNYLAWTPRSHGYQGCIEDESEAFMQAIGTQHGVTAMTEVWRKEWPDKTKPNRDQNDLATWGAIDKIERTLLLLVEGHDEQAASADA